MLFPESCGVTSAVAPQLEHDAQTCATQNQLQHSSKHHDSGDAAQTARERKARMRNIRQRGEACPKEGGRCFSCTASIAMVRSARDSMFSCVCVALGIFKQLALHVFISAKT